MLLFFHLQPLPVRSVLISHKGFQREIHLFLLQNILLPIPHNMSCGLGAGKDRSAFQTGCFPLLREVNAVPLPCGHNNRSENILFQNQFLLSSLLFHSSSAFLLYAKHVFHILFLSEIIFQTVCHFLRFVQSSCRQHLIQHLILASRGTLDFFH